MKDPKPIINDIMRVTKLTPKKARLEACRLAGIEYSSLKTYLSKGMPEKTYQLLHYAWESEKS